MKAKPLVKTHADQCAEMLADMRREHPGAPLEFACRTTIDFAAMGGPIPRADTDWQIVGDPSLKPGQVYLRIRWS